MKPGDLFGAYRILRRLDGRSGYEEFLGLDRARFLYVRLRVPTPGAEGAVVELLRAQGEVRKRASHPCMAALVEEGDLEGCPYLALEYVAGKPLQGLMPFDEGEVVDLALKMLDFFETLAGLSIIPWRIGSKDWLLSKDGQLRLLEVLSPPPDLSQMVGGRRIHLASMDFLRGGPWDEACLVHAYCSLLVELITEKPLLMGCTAKSLLAEHEGIAGGASAEAIDALPPGWSELVTALFTEDAPKTLEELRPILKTFSASSVLGEGDDRLAILERADTQYWKAMSLTNEGRIEEALAELTAILGLSSELLTTMGTSLSTLAETLYWKAASDREDGEWLPPEAFADFLRAVLLLHRKCGALHRARVVERHLLESILIDFGQNPDDQEHRFRQALSLCADPLVTKQEYARFLSYRGEKEKARNVQIQLAGRYRQRGHIEAALRELGKVREGAENFRYAAVHGQVKRQAMRLDMEREDLCKCLGTMVHRKRRVEKAQAFLERHPGDVKGMEIILGEEESLNLDPHELEEIRFRLAVRHYECFALDEAVENFRALLRTNPRREDALTYLADCLRRKGVKVHGGDRSEWVRHLHEEIGKGSL